MFSDLDRLGGHSSPKYAANDQWEQKYTIVKYSYDGDKYCWCQRRGRCF